MLELKNNQPLTTESLGLSLRETEVLNHVAEGKTNREISLLLGISGRTVEKHLERVYAKLGVKTRTGAAVMLYRLRRAQGTSPVRRKAASETNNRFIGN